MNEALTWIDVRERRPDADVTVLLFAPKADGEPAWPGYRDEDGDSGRDVWRWAEGLRVEAEVTHWAEMPAGPGGAA